MDRRTAILLALAVLVLALIPLGVAAFVLGFALGDSPCILCWGQRIGMGLVALLGAFILRHGPKPRYVGLGVLVGAFGIYMALRHSAAHFQRDIGQGFSLEILGAHTYAWSLLIYWICVVVMGLLLLTLKEGELKGSVRDLGRLGRFALGSLVVVLAANALQAFMSAGPPPFVGPGDPVRFSWNPKNWAWTLEEWHGGGPSVRGAWDIPKPDLLHLEQDPAQGPFQLLPRLTLKGWLQVPNPIAQPRDLAIHPETGRALVVTQDHRVAVLDPAFTRVEAWTRVDPGFSLDLGEGFVGAAWRGNELYAMAENKSWVSLKEAPAGTPESWRHFLENRAAFLETGRGRFATVRARQNYVSALASGPGGLYCAAIPNAKKKALVISRFDGKDLMLSEEFVLTLAGGAPSLVQNRSLSLLVPVGLAATEDRLYLMSGAYGTLVEVDLTSRQIRRAWTVEGLPRPVGLAIRGQEFLILCADGRIAVVERP